MNYSLAGVYSLRKYHRNKMFFSQIVYEWEDDIANHFHLKIHTPDFYTYGKARLLKNSKATVKFRQNKKVHFAFILFPSFSKFYGRKSIIPIFLDTWGFNKEIICDLLEPVQVAIFTNYNMFEMMCGRFPDKQIFYVPLGATGKLWNVCQNAVKTIHVVQIGRRNETLHEYMKQFCREYPGIEYVYRDSFESGEYISNIRGDIGKIVTRNEYIELLKSAKVSLVSTPGADDLTKTGGVDFFTPRFYESICAGCHLIGRYTENKEAKILKIGQLCPNVKNYQEFSSAMQQSLRAEPDRGKYQEFSQKTALVNCLEDAIRQSI